MDKDLGSTLKTETTRIGKRIKEHMDTFPEDSLFWIDQKAGLSECLKRLFDVGGTRATGENAHATGVIAHETPTMKMRKKQGE